VSHKARAGQATIGARGAGGDAHDSPVSPSPAAKARGANICASKGGAAPQQAGAFVLKLIF